MRTVHISDELWTTLKIHAATRGVPLREVVEEAGRAWAEHRASALSMVQPVYRPEPTKRDVLVSQPAKPNVAALKAQLQAIAPMRELTVETEE